MDKDTNKSLATREEPRLLQRFTPTTFGLFPEFDQLRRDFDHMVNRIFGRGWDDLESPAFDGGRMGALDLYETGNELQLSMELPGIDQKDINLSVTSDSVTISAERSAEEGKEEGHYHWRRSSSGRHYQSIRLPVEVKPDETRATLKNGVLRVVMPKAKQSAAQSVKIDVE